jgi:excinuclease ABC subunit C
MDTLLRVFPVRSCSAGVFRRAEQSGRPCLLGYIDKCSAPCVGRISEEDHRALADDFCAFMGGEARRFITGLERKMADAVADLDYENAARLRDDIVAMRKVFERNAVVLSEETDADVFAVEEDELEAAVQVFHVRGGRIRGQRGWIVEKVEDTTPEALVGHLLQQVYGDEEQTNGRLPREVLVPVMPEDADELGLWLTGLRGARVEVRVPQRGDKAALLGTVHENAVQALRLHKSRRAGDITTRSLALQELQEALELPEPPLRIESFDISHVQGTNVVASMVVVEDGLTKKSEYRKFTITGDAARDDTAAMHDVLTRRFRNYLAERERPVEERDSGKFAYPPNLVVVDGGQPQVTAAVRALAELGIGDEVRVVGLAKRLEEVWLPEGDFPVILPRASQGLYLLQRIRDEAHRFAITFHRQRRAKSMTASILDEVPGLGPARQKAVLAHFGSLKRLRAASVTEITEVNGVGPSLAAAIHARLHGVEQPAPAVNYATGEIVES